VISPETRERGLAPGLEKRGFAVLTFEQIKELIELVAERGLQGLEVERSGFRLKVDGQSVAPQVVYAAAASAEPSLAAAPAAPQARPMPAVAAGGTAAAPAPPPAEKAGPPPGSHIITSPIVGTFYRSPSPDAPSFVEVGSRVKKGQVLCIIEAMKLMNEIESDVDGEILEIYPQNAQPVEFGEPLFAVRASGS
jgi:acetyl-CoA carboxylase biotin carboxyl carrier protein